jgi:hypothetical protein
MKPPERAIDDGFCYGTQGSASPSAIFWRAQQLEIWVSPWGFLKGAQQFNATASWAM